MYEALGYWLQGVLEGKHLGNTSKALYKRACIHAYARLYTSKPLTLYTSEALYIQEALYKQASHPLQLKASYASSLRPRILGVLEGKHFGNASKALRLFERALLIDPNNIGLSLSLSLSLSHAVGPQDVLLAANVS